MHIRVEIPPLEKYQQGFPGYWLGLVFMNNAPEAWQIRSLVTSYVRLVESAFRSYSSGKEHLEYFWIHCRPDELPLSRVQAATMDFETCLTSMHRAVRIFTVLRSRQDTPAKLKAELFTKPQFVAERIAGRVRRIRDLTQHVEEMLADGTIPNNANFMLMAEGDEVPVPGEPGQTIKTIDRLTIGKEEVLFTELHDWLTQLGDYAEAITKYDFSKQ